MLLFLHMVDTPEEKTKFEQLHDSYKYLMLHEAKEITKDYHLAEDALQEAFLRVGKNLDKIDDVKDPKTRSYLIKIVRNTALTLYNKRKENMDVSLEEHNFDFQSQINIEQQMINSQKVKKLVVAIRDLPQIYKDVIYLSFGDGYEVNEIAKILNLHKDTVRKRLQRARKFLVDILMEDERKALQKEKYLNERAKEG